MDPDLVHMEMQDSSGGIVIFPCSWLITQVTLVGLLSHRFDDEKSSVFRPGLFGAAVLKQGMFDPKDQLVWSFGSTAIMLGCRT